MIKRLEDQALRYTLGNPGSIFDVCFSIINQHGLSAAMSSKKISDYEGADIVITDNIGASEHFRAGSKIILSTIEALSMAYLTTYYRELAEPGTSYMIGVDIEDRRSGQTERELYLSDGLLAEFHDGEAGSITPFQQVIAQNIIGKNKGKEIQGEIVKSINSKTSRRSTYNDVSGLIINVLAKDTSVIIKSIIDSCDLNVFNPTFLMIYHDDLSSCTVIHLDNNISSTDELKKRAYKIIPSLVKEK